MVLRIRVPSLGTGTTSGGVTVAARWNPADASGNAVISNGGLSLSEATINGFVRSIQYESSGQKYVEFVANGTTSRYTVGLANASETVTNVPGGTANSIGVFSLNGVIKLNNVTVATMASAFGLGDTLGIFIDFSMGTTGKCWFFLNNVQSGSSGVPGVSGGLDLPPGALALHALNQITNGSTLDIRATTTYAPGGSFVGFGGAAPFNVALGATESADVPAFNAAMILTAALANTEGADVPAFSLSTTLVASFANTETADTPLFGGAFGTSLGAVLAATESNDTPAFVATAVLGISLTIAESADIPAFAGNPVVTASMGWTEAPDVPAANVRWALMAAFTSTESADAPAFNANTTVAITASLGNIERPDIPNIDARPPQIVGTFSNLELSDVPFFGYVSTLYTENMLKGPPKARVLKPRF